MTLLTILNAAKLQMARAQYLRHARRAMPERTFGPDDIWHSWDTHPWKHPWLSRDNMARMKQFSSDFLAKERANNQHADPARLKTGFVGNIANCMYTRAVPLRKAGWSVDLFLHPHDTYVMSQPWWEEYDGTLPPEIRTQDQVTASGVSVPFIEGIHQLAPDPDWQEKLKNPECAFLRPGDPEAYPGYLANFPTLLALRQMDVLWATQMPYLAYLANMPYVVSQTGGDIWFEASRADELGKVQRRAFAEGRVFLVSNPISFAHARRLGLNRLIYLPIMLDETLYAPGVGESRVEWKTQSGGDFFVLTSSRLDERNKGSSIGLEGFARFAQSHPGARLVVIGWGNDHAAKLAQLDAWGIANKVVVLPIAGKARLRDYLRSADVFIDQFVLGYYGTAGLEATACGVPVIGRIEHDQYDALCETGAPPFHNTSDAEGVHQALTQLADDTGYRAHSGAAHRRWFLENHGTARWMDDYVAILNATANRQAADFTASPLNEALSLHECSYQAQQLALAPPHPHYGW